MCTRKVFRFRFANIKQINNAKEGTKKSKQNLASGKKEQKIDTKRKINDYKYSKAGDCEEKENN